jgi:hypothetical protein
MASPLPPAAPSGSGSPPSPPPERLVDFTAGVGARQPDIAQHAVIETGELVTVAAAPPPFAQCGNHPISHVAERDASANLLRNPSGIARRRSQRNSSHDHLQVRQSGRTRSGVRGADLPETSPNGWARSRSARCSVIYRLAVSSLSGSCHFIRSAQYVRTPATSFLKNIG